MVLTLGASKHDGASRFLTGRMTCSATHDGQARGRLATPSRSSELGGMPDEIGEAGAGRAQRLAIGEKCHLDARERVMGRLAWPLRPLPDGRGEVWRWDLGTVAELPAARAGLREPPG